MKYIIPLFIMTKFGIIYGPEIVIYIITSIIIGYGIFVIVRELYNLLQELKDLRNFYIMSKEELDEN